MTQLEPGWYWYKTSGHGVLFPSQRCLMLVVTPASAVILDKHGKVEAMHKGQTPEELGDFLVHYVSQLGPRISDPGDDEFVPYCETGL